MHTYIHTYVHGKVLLRNTDDYVILSNTWVYSMVVKIYAIYVLLCIQTDIQPFSQSQNDNMKEVLDVCIQLFTLVF